jgi:hypothetical protein
MQALGLFQENIDDLVGEFAHHVRERNLGRNGYSPGAQRRIETCSGGLRPLSENTGVVRHVTNVVPKDGVDLPRGCHPADPIARGTE